MFVVLTVIVVITMLGFMGLSMARHDVMGSGDLIDARSMESSAYSGHNLAVARLEIDPEQTRLELGKFLADSAAPNRRQWFDFSPASGKSFELVATQPNKISVKGTSGVNSSVLVRVVSMDVGGVGGLPPGGMKVTIEATGTGRSGESVSTVSSYRLLGLDVQRKAINTYVAVPRHALYLSGNMQSAGGAMEYTGDVFISGGFHGNSGAVQTVHGKLKVGGNMALPSGSPVYVDDNAWINGYLDINSSNEMWFKKSLGVGAGLKRFNDNLKVDGSLSIHGGAAENPSWADGKTMVVGGQLLVSRQKAFPQRAGTITVGGNAFFNNGFYSPDKPGTDWFKKRLEIRNLDGGAANLRNDARMSINVDGDFYTHRIRTNSPGGPADQCSFAFGGNGTKILKVLGKSRLGNNVGVVNGGNVFHFSQSYYISNLIWGGCADGLCPPIITGSGTRVYNDNVIPELFPVPLTDPSIGMAAADTNLSPTLTENRPDSIILTSAVIAKMHRISTYCDSAKVPNDWQNGGTGRHLNKMYQYASTNGGLLNGYLVLLIDKSNVAITYQDASDAIEGKLLLIIDQPVSSGLDNNTWPHSKTSSAIQIVYIPAKTETGKTIHGVTFTGNGNLSQFAVTTGGFYGYVFSEKAGLSIKTKFANPTQFRGAISLIGANSYIEPLSGKLDIRIDQDVFKDIQTSLGVIKNPASSTPPTLTVVVSHEDGLVARQSRLQCVPLGVYR